MPTFFIELHTMQRKSIEISAVPNHTCPCKFSINNASHIFCRCLENRNSDFRLTTPPFFILTRTLARLKSKVKGGAGCIPQIMSLNSTASERGDDLTLDSSGNVRINGIPRRRLQVVSLAQFETRGKSQTARLEEIMRKKTKGRKK